jgi:hypothetical protein
LNWKDIQIKHYELKIWNPNFLLQFLINEVHHVVYYMIFRLIYQWFGLICFVQVMTLHALLMIPDGKGITTQGIPSLMSAKRHPVFQPPSALTAPGLLSFKIAVKLKDRNAPMWPSKSRSSGACYFHIDIY